MDILDIYFMTKGQFNKIKAGQGAYLCWQQDGFSSYITAIDRTAKKIQLGLTGSGRENRWFDYKKVTLGFPPKSRFFVGMCNVDGYEDHIVERLEKFKK